MALRDARQHFECADNYFFFLVGIDSRILRQFTSQRGRSELRCHSRRQLFRVVADNVIEAVVPKIQNIKERRMTSLQSSHAVKSRMPRI